MEGKKVQEWAGRRGLDGWLVWGIICCRGRARDGISTQREWNRVGGRVMNDERRVWEDGRERWMRQREGMMEGILMSGYRYIAIATSLTIIWYLESWEKSKFLWTQYTLGGLCCSPPKYSIVMVTAVTATVRVARSNHSRGDSSNPEPVCQHGQSSILYILPSNINKT